MKCNKNPHKKLQVYEAIRKQHEEHPKIAIEKITTHRFLAVNPSVCILCGEFQPSIVTHHYCIPCINSVKAFRQVSNKAYAYLHLIGQKLNNDVNKIEKKKAKKARKASREHETEFEFVSRIASSTEAIEKRLKTLLRSKTIFPDNHVCRICKTVDKERSVTKVCKTCLGTLRYGKAQKFKYLSMIVEHVKNTEQKCVKTAIPQST
jgi:hypothetical protein